MQKKYWVYLMIIEGSNICKIGLSSDPKQRRIAIEHSMPFKVELIATSRIFIHKLAKEAEKNLKIALSQFGMRGEWFLLPSHIIHRVRMLLQEHRDFSGAPRTLIGLFSKRRAIKNKVLSPKYYKNPSRITPDDTLRATKKLMDSARLSLGLKWRPTRLYVGKDLTFSMAPRSIWRRVRGSNRIPESMDLF